MTAIMARPSASDTSVPSGLDDETLVALAREKELFAARNADRCSHLLVRYHVHDDDRLVLTAAFTLDEARIWHTTDATVHLTNLRRDHSPDHGLITAFGELDEGISAARIARLFAPLSIAQRMAGGRRD